MSAAGIDWPALERLDWVDALRTCPQDPEFHAEGDVWTHTRMVVDALLGLPEFRDLSEWEKGVLLTAAVLHDVAKPVCTVEDRGRIVSPGHAKVGERIARELLWDFDLEFRETVCALVRLHGLPLWGFEKPDPVRAAILAGWRVRNALTVLLARADVLGRRTASQADLLYRLDLYRELCLENDCYAAPRPHFNAHSRFRYFRSDATWPTEQFDNTGFEVTLLSGIAGSGKDTYYQKHLAHLPVVSLDAIRKQLKIRPDDRQEQGRVAQAAYETAKEYCRRKASFVWNSTNLTTDLRNRLIGALSVYEPRFRIVYLETTEANILQRRRSDIKADVLERMRRQLEIPLVYEAHAVEWMRG